MPRYFFHQVAESTYLDGQGLELLDPGSARQRAFKIARTIASLEVMDGYLNLSHRIMVEDESGTMDTVTFEDAVRLER